MREIFPRAVGSGCGRGYDGPGDRRHEQRDQAVPPPILLPMRRRFAKPLKLAPASAL